MPKLRVYFRLDPTDWHGRSNEGLWAEPIENATPGTVFRLLNSPFFARGVSYLDIVQTAPRESGVGREFAGVVDRGGHSTYMILVPPESKQFPDLWEELRRLGCSYESMTINLSVGVRTLHSVDVPDVADIHAVYNVLKKGEANDSWMFQEGHAGHDALRRPATGKQ